MAVVCRKFYAVLFPDLIRPVRMAQIKDKLLHVDYPARREDSNTAVENTDTNYRPELVARISARSV